MNNVISTPNGDMPIIYEDDCMLVVSKPHGLHTVQDRRGVQEVTARSVLDQRYGKIYVVHRLDASTGGAIVFAKDEYCHAMLCRQFEKSDVQKRYLAITVKAEIFPVTVMLPISAKIAHGKYKINFKSGRSASTTIFPLKSSLKGNLVQAIPHTGRTHQIRVHLKALKAPIYRDWIYNTRIEDRRVALFADTIAISHPISGEKMKFSAELSDFMKECLTECGIDWVKGKDSFARGNQ